jgi:uncharacterized protein YgiM (DUF1202 family)
VQCFRWEAQERASSAPLNSEQSKPFVDVSQRRNPGEHPADEGGNFGVVKTAPNDPVNLRETPSAKAKIVTALNNGTKVTVLGGKNVGSSRWLNVTTSGNSGWVAARHLEII